MLQNTVFVSIDSIEKKDTQIFVDQISLVNFFLLQCVSLVLVTPTAYSMGSTKLGKGIF